MRNQPSVPPTSFHPSQCNETTFHEHHEQTAHPERFHRRLQPFLPPVFQVFYGLLVLGSSCAFLSHLAIKKGWIQPRESHEIRRMIVIFLLCADFMGSALAVSLGLRSWFPQLRHPQHLTMSDVGQKILADGRSICSQPWDAW